jgi:hypothetical protein
MDLEIRQHERFQQREWRVQRVGWALMTLLVLAALLGFFGPGPFSWSSARGPAGLLEVDYQRVTHLEADDSLSVIIDPRAVTGNSVALVVDPEWVAAMDINSVTPQPDSETATPEGLELTIATTPGAHTTVTFTYRPTRIGRVDGGMALDGDRVAVSQLVLP